MRHEWTDRASGDTALVVDENLEFSIGGHLAGRGYVVELLTAEILRLAERERKLREALAEAADLLALAGGTEGEIPYQVTGDGGAGGGVGALNVALCLFRIRALLKEE